MILALSASAATAKNPRKAQKTQQPETSEGFDHYMKRGSERIQKGSRQPASKNQAYPDGQSDVKNLEKETYPSKE